MRIHTPKCTYDRTLSPSSKFSGGMLPKKIGKLWGART